jgi:2-dehydro-3-deoxyphosphogluconate aldolase/(4S)-4-hydroxy-2-oxoglutarate aldolase
MTRTRVLEAIERERCVAIVRGLDTDQTLACVDALRRGGIILVEVSCYSPAAMDTIRALRAAHGDALTIGAGTVLDVEAVAAAREAGAGFILSPDTNAEVIAATRGADLVSVPGALSPTEARAAMRAGADIVKIFPAGAVGPGYIKDLLGPLSDGRFMAVGGVDLENIAAFFRAGVISVGIGGSLLDKKLIAAGDMAGLAALAKRFLDAVPNVSSQGGAA